MNTYRVSYHQHQKFWGVVEKPFRGPRWHGDRNITNSPSRQNFYWIIDIDDINPGDAILSSMFYLEKEGVIFNDFTTEAYRIIYEGVRHCGNSSSKIIWWAYPINPRAVEMITEPTVCWWNEGDTFLQIDVRDSYPYLALNYADNAIAGYLKENK